MDDFISHFLKKHHFKNPSLLLALSGGPDSLFLFHHLLTATKKGDCLLSVAHLDHGWRESSYREALALKEKCEHHQIPFYLHKEKFEGNNIEDKGRNARFKFFKRLVQEYQFDAVVLGHQADDVAETVLKRVFEGSSLTKLYSLKEVSQREGITLLRPLLNFRKKEILQWFERRGETPFIDETNESSDFLRGKMRSSLFPELSKTFGKEIVPALCRISKHASELQDFLDVYLKKYESCIKRSCLGTWADFTQIKPNTQFEWKTLLMRLANQWNTTISDSHLEQIIEHLKNNAASKILLLGKARLYIDRSSLFYFESQLDKWSITFEKGKERELSHWKNLWEKGYLQATIPYCESYEVGFQNDKSFVGLNKSLSRRYSNYKVPSCLKDKVPYIVDLKTKTLVFEFLTGREIDQKLKKASLIKIKLNYSKSMR